MSYIRIFYGNSLGAKPKLKGEKFMDFIKKNWAKLAQALLFAFGGALALFALIQVSGEIARLDDTDLTGEASIVTILVYIGALVGFFGFAITHLLKGIAPAYTKYGFIGTGFICTVLYLIVIVMAGRMDVLGVITKSVEDELGTASAKYHTLKYVVPTFWSVYAPFLYFGLAPLVKGLRRILHKETDEIAVAAKRPEVKTVATPVTAK
jgi:hypothetical protein